MVTFKIFTVKVETGLVQDPISALTLIWPPDKPIAAVMVFTEDVPVKLLGKIQRYPVALTSLVTE